MTDLLSSVGCANQIRRFGTLREGSACRHTLSSVSGLEAAHQQENDQDHEDDTKNTVRAIALTSAVEPRRNAPPDLTACHGNLASEYSLACSYRSQPSPGLERKGP
jgi:hypothetical protein